MFRNTKWWQKQKSERNPWKNICCRVPVQWSCQKAKNELQSELSLRFFRVLCLVFWSTNFKEHLWQKNSQQIAEKTNNLCFMIRHCADLLALALSTGYVLFVFCKGNKRGGSKRLAFCSSFNHKKSIIQ